MDLRSRLRQLQNDRTDTRMPVAERLQRLTIRDDSRQQTPGRQDEDLARRLQGELIAPGVVLVEQRFPLVDDSGKDFAARLRLLADLHDTAPGELLFLDTETTGLAGGTGTLVFLLGLARSDGLQLHCRQWFLTSFRGEAAFLTHAAAWLNEARCLVSYNGKSFDMPLLTARCRLARLPAPWTALQHVDLLHPTRRAFGRLWPDCRLQTAERQLLGLTRIQDLPGQLVPEVWVRFVRTGDLRQIPAILEHNLQDLVSLAALLQALLRVYAEPGLTEPDALAIARYLRQRDMTALAREHLVAMQSRLDAAGLLELADIHRERRSWDDALPLWHDLAIRGEPRAMEHLAKYHEHRQRDFQAALIWTERLLGCQRDDRRHALRKARLLQRLGSP